MSKKKVTDLHKISEFLLGEFGKPRKFKPHVVMDIDNQCIHINLEDCESYSEWIKGEGGDITLQRAMNDNRVIGALLPLRKWKGKGKMSVYLI
jgi:hypothetical protein